MRQNIQKWKLINLHWAFKDEITETSKESTSEITQTSIPISEVTSVPTSEVIETLVPILEVIDISVQTWVIEISVPTSEVRGPIQKRIILIYNNLVINYNKKK